MSHLMRPPSTREPGYSNPRFAPPNVRLPFQSPPEQRMNRPPLSVTCLSPAFQYPRHMAPPLVSSSIPCPNPMSFPPPPIRPPDPRVPPPHPMPVYSESPPPYKQLYNVPPPHSSSHPENPSQVYVPPYPPPAMPATSFPNCTDPVATEHRNSLQPPSEPFRSNVQTPSPSIPYGAAYHHQDRKLETMLTSGGCNLKVSNFVETPSYKRDEYQRCTSQGMPADIGDENAYLKYKERERRRSDDRSSSRGGYDSRRSSDHLEYEGQHWERFVRRRSRSPLHRGSPQRRRSRSPLNDRRRSRSPLNERRRSRSPLNERRRSRSPLNERRRSRSPANERRRSRSPLNERRRSRSPGNERRRSRSPGNERRRSRSPGNERRRSRSLLNERRRSRDSSRSSDQRPHTRDCKWSRARNSKDKGSRDRASKSPGKIRQSGESKKCTEIGDKEVSVSTELESPARNVRYSNSPEYSRSHSRASFRRSSRSPNYRSRKRSRSYSPESLKSLSSRATRSSYKEKRAATERELLLEKWRMNYCATSAEMQKKLEELAKMKPEEIVEHEKKVWTRTAPADLYYVRDEKDHKVMKATPRLLALCERFREELVVRAEKVRASRPKYEPPPRKSRLRLAKHKSEMCSSSDSSSEESSTDEEDCKMEELERKQLHPYRLHPEMWYNDSGEMNDGPLCCCSAKARRYGIRHGIYSGETHLPKCNPNTNNADRLYHYRITISPPTNFLTKTPTIIKHDEHEFIFEGFSMFSHFPLDKLPTCKVIRFNIEYTILYIDEKLPENFTIQELDLFYDYLFRELLELVDLDFKAHGDSSGCSQFHFMPRFVRDLADNGKEILSMNEVMYYLIVNSRPLIEESKLEDLLAMSQSKWQNFADEVKGMVVTYPGMKPCSVRVDQLDREQQKTNDIPHPEIVHFGIRPPQLSYAGNPEYQKAWREYVKFRHLLANMPKPSFEDKRKLESKENKLQEMRTQSKMKRDVTVAVSSKGFHRTGIMCDIIQHAMLIPVLVCHLRFHQSCDVLEKVIDYKFKNRFLLQLALTHPSYRENFGTNSDHARNSLTNCGIRQPEYGDRRIHYMNTRKRGINTLINIMSRFGKKTETESNITHNERLEFLGDAVVEFLTSIHLFHMFPDLEEGGLATYRAAIVQNQHLAVLAKILRLEEYMLYAHGSDLCHDLELRHAMANCFEALMGALFLDGGIEVADKVFAETFFENDPDLLDVWVNYPPHPLQEQEPLGDRKWIPSFELLQNLTKFEESIGVEFKHIRLLARAFTDRSIGYTNLTLGSNQRLEFLGDTVLQLIASEYLYKYFPEHHEGHLSLLRSSLVNNRTQAVVCDDLGMISYALYSNPKVELKTKDRADLLEAFLGALYVDKGLDYCHVFCHVCFFPRLQDFIMNQDWNDPKSKLQQCCLTVRTMEGGEPDIPVYKVIECKGPTNTRVYTVAVYFRGERLAKASGHSIQQAEMNAAKEALELSQGLFPQLDHQKRVIAKSLWRQHCPSRSMSHARSPQSSFDRETPSSSKDRSKTSSSLHQQKKTSSSSSSSSSKSQQSTPTQRPAVSSDNKPEPVPSSEVSTGKQ